MKHINPRNSYLHRLSVLPTFSNNVIYKKILPMSISIIIVMKLYRFELLFFDGTVLTEKFRVEVPLNIQSIHLSIFSIIHCTKSHLQDSSDLSDWTNYLRPCDRSTSITNTATTITAVTSCEYP